MRSGCHEGRICTVSTVLDSVPNVTEFVARNLRSGADHMFVFLDGDLPDVRRHLTGVDHVTVVHTDDAYWRGARPPRLNSRQTINANLVNVLLSPFAGVRWLFHLDGDECLDVDRSELLSAPGTAAAARLSVLEALSDSDGNRDPEQFKRVPTPDELALLTILDVIPRPRLREYFHGHFAGKPGIRPTLDLRLRIHRVQDLAGRSVEELRSPGLNVLHYDCWSVDEFVRKWSAHMESGLGKFVGKRDLVRGAVAAVWANDRLDGPQKKQILASIYRSTFVDDAAALRELGLLVTPREEHHRYQPRGLPRGDGDAIHRLLGRLATGSHEPLRVDPRVPHPGSLFRSLLEGPGLDSDLADRIEATLRRTTTFPD